MTASDAKRRPGGGAVPESHHSTADHDQHNGTAKDRVRGHLAAIDAELDALIEPEPANRPRPRQLPFALCSRCGVFAPDCVCGGVASAEIARSSIASARELMKAKR